MQFQPKILFLFLLLFPLIMMGQTAQVEGIVTDENNKTVEWANVAVMGEKGGTTTNENGHFSLAIPAEKEITLVISFIGFSDRHIRLNLKEGEHKVLKTRLVSMSTELPGFEVKDEQLRTESMVRLNPKVATVTPTITGGVEDIIKTLPGVSSNNELSSQYSVRGGNFDENLVYVNDIEIYRPFLVNSGQQEGLSFVNSSLVSSILFSAGGFGAQYGDKMSSVLDVKYMKPAEFGGSFSISLLGAELSLGGTSKDDKFTYLLGGRYKTNNYILNNMDTQGEYKTNFFDFQSQLTWEFNPKWDLSFLGYYSRNQYKVTPKSRETNFGTIQESLRFKVYFDGNETDKFEMFQGGLTLSFHPQKDLNLKFIASAFSTLEMETYDVQGQYWIGKTDNNLGSDDFGEAIQTKGIGTYLEHARNYFKATVITLEHKGSFTQGKRFLKWGIRYQHQMVDDRLREWEMIDSAGYSLPHPGGIPGDPHPDNPNLSVNYFAAGKNDVNINRMAAFISNRWHFNLKNNDLISLTAGLRAYYWDYNNEFLLAPRINASYKPYKKQNIVFRFATGVYYQPPFYREMRNMDGTLNPNIKSQRAIHFILGSDYRFQAWNRPFIFTTELYYKKLDNLIPYVVDNVRIRYYADQLAKGYAAGIDFKVYGEFVKGIDSWLSLSFMKTEEDIYGDYYYQYYNAEGEQIGTGDEPDPEASESVKVEPGYIPRPSDQRVNFSILFQDYIPGAPYLTMHLRLLYSTGMPFGPPDSERYTQTLRMPDYRRVDIGFSWQFVNEGTSFGPKNPFRGFNSMILSLEVFNLLQTFNTISYIWVKDINNQQYAVPNYLTPRLLNLKLAVAF
ncbi:MAG: TonB-dependent receptor [Bacteroidetes bacterium]|nr:MAG: TonB-dependent receptor [Bacteroidota bacterium]